MGLAAALVVVVVAVLAWASIASFAGAGPAGAATAFFKTIAEKGPQAAYASTSATFQQATPADAFAQAVQARGVADFKSADWSVKSQAGDLAEVSGAISSKSGAVTPAELRLVKGASGWQVLSLAFLQGGLSGSTAAAAADSQGGYDSTAGASPATQPAYPTPQQSPSLGSAGSAGLIGGAQPSQPNYPSAPAGAPYGSPGAAMGMVGGDPQQAGGISRSRIARICGKTLMHNSWADTVQLHCPDPMGVEPGSTARCMAVVNGRQTGMTATLEHYDAERDDAQLSCRLDG